MALKVLHNLPMKGYSDNNCFLKLLLNPLDKVKLSPANGFYL